MRRVASPLWLGLAAWAYGTYVDPAASITNESFGRHCHKGVTSNHAGRAAEGPLVASRALESASNITAWTRAYARAMRRGHYDTRLLVQLRAERQGGYQLNPNLDQDWFDFINGKTHILDALENRAGLSELWAPMHRLLDVGCGHCFLAAYLQARHRLFVKGYDVPSSYQCREIMASPLLVNFFDGVMIPEPRRSFDAVSFMSVLHHAAKDAPSLLQSAAAIARRWILVIEDTDNGKEPVRIRNHQHDPRGIFLSDGEWKALFNRSCPGFTLASSGLVGQSVFNKHARLFTHVEGDESRRFMHWYVLERVPRQRYSRTVPSRAAALARNGGHRTQPLPTVSWQGPGKASQNDG